VFCLTATKVSAELKTSEHISAKQIRCFGGRGPTISLEYLTGFFSKKGSKKHKNEWIPNQNSWMLY